MIKAISSPMIRNIALATMLTASTAGFSACTGKPSQNTENRTELYDSNSAKVFEKHTIYNITSHQHCKHADEKYKEVMGKEPNADIYEKYGLFAGTVLVQTEAAQNLAPKVFEKYCNYLATNTENIEFTNSQLLDLLSIKEYVGERKDNDMVGNDFIKPLMDEAIKKDTPNFTKVSEALDQLARHIRSAYCGYDKKEDDAMFYDFYKTFVIAYDQEKNGKYHTVNDLADVIMFKTILINRLFFMCNLINPEDIPGMEDYIDEHFTNYFVENL